MFTPKSEDGLLSDSAEHAQDFTNESQANALVLALATLILPSLGLLLALVYRHQDYQKLYCQQIQLE